jgi:hypothetical protein
MACQPRAQCPCIEIVCRRSLRKGIQYFRFVTPILLTDILEDAEVEHEEIKNMIRELQEAESDDDQAWDELFEDMMETARVHFTTEEQDLLPLIDTRWMQSYKLSTT